MARGYTKLGRRSDNRRALIRDLATQLFLHGRIETSVVKAKEIKRVAEKLITLAKRGDLHAMRLAGETVRELSIDNQTALQKLFKEYGPKYQGRNGGYTRIYRIGNRQGDACPMAILELV
jgi:large subunit ribosomal protein L17